MFDKFNQIRQKQAKEERDAKRDKLAQINNLNAHLIQEIKDYQFIREGENTFYFFRTSANMFYNGIVKIFGCESNNSQSPLMLDKITKLKAADKLLRIINGNIIEELSPHEIAALKNGKLGKAIKKSGGGLENTLERAKTQREIMADLERQKIASQHVDEKHTPFKDITRRIFGKWS